MCRKSKQAFVVIQFDPLKASRRVIKPHYERKGPSRVEVLGAWEGRDRLWGERVP